MATRKKVAPKLTPKGVSANAVKKLTAEDRKIDILTNKCTNYDKEIAKKTDDSIIGKAYRMKLGRKRAEIIRELNSHKAKRNLLQARINNYIANDEAVLKERGLYWGA